MTDDFFNIISSSLFGLLMMSLLVDVFCALTWNKTYFTSGLTIFVKRMPVDHWHTNIPQPSLFETMFHSDWASSFTFKEVDRLSYAFRENIFQFRLMRYTPVMHGLLTFDSDNGQVIVKGFVNWYAFSFSLVWIAMLILFTISMLSYATIMFSILIVLGAILALTLVMGILYTIQSSRFTKIASFAAESWARKYVRDDDKAQQSISHSPTQSSVTHPDSPTRSKE